MKHVDTRDVAMMELLFYIVTGMCAVLLALAIFA